MPGVGVGGLVSNLMNPGLDQTIAKQVTPDPSPLAQQGQGQGPGQAGGSPTDQSGNAYARAAVTQQDPVVATLAENLVKAQRQSMYAADLNRNLEGVAAGFGTAGQQAAKQAALRGAGGGGADEIGMWQNIQGINKEQASQNDRARFMGNIHVFAQSLSTAMGRPVSDDEAMEIASSPDMTRESAQAFGANSTLTGTTKDADQATASWRKANPNATPEQEAAFRSSIISMGSGGGNMEDMAYRNYAQDEISHGRVPDNIVVWKGKQGSVVKSTNDINQTNLDAKQSWPQVSSVWDEHLRTIDWLHDPSHRDAVVAAITHPEVLTKGYTGNFFKMVGITSQEVETAKNYLTQYHDQLTADKFTTSKNVRSNFEAKFLGGSASHLFEPTNDSKAIGTELDRLYDETHTRYGNAAAAAGQQIPYDLSTKVDKSLLDSNNPLYNGATVAPPPKQDAGGGGGGAGGGGKGNPLPAASDAYVRKKLQDSPASKDALIKHFEGLGFDMSPYK